MLDRTVVLTDEEGNATGTSNILEAHTGAGKLHRAFSVYVFNETEDMILVQQRAAQKMLFALLWANTCCSHPFPKEDIIEAGERRLREECGFTVPLEYKDAFVYKAEDPNGNGIEWEHDSLLVGHANELTKLNPDPTEIAQLEWRQVQDVLHDMKTTPNEYAPWFKMGLNKLLHG